MANLPQNTLLDDVSAEIGYTATTVLSSWYGGRIVLVPTTLDPNHLLCRLLGNSAYSRLIGAFAGDRIFVPRDNRQAIRHRRQVYSLISHGVSPQKAAEILALSQQQVHNIRKSLEEDNILPTVLRNPPAREDASFGDDDLEDAYGAC